MPGQGVLGFSARHNMRIVMKYCARQNINNNLKVNIQNLFTVKLLNESDPRSDVHYLGSSENKAWKKFQACTIETLVCRHPANLNSWVPLWFREKP